MNDDPESLGTDGEAGELAGSPATAKTSYNEIAFRAYFLALNRNARGEPANPLKDWLEAER